MNPFPLVALLVLLAGPAGASTNYLRELVRLEWDPSPSPDVVSYRIYHGPTSHGYTNSISLGNVTNVTITLDPNQQGIYYFAATATGNTGLESDFSNEIAYMLSSTNAPAPPPDMRVLTVMVQRSTNLVNWTIFTNFQAVYVGTTNGTKFYRSVLFLTNGP